MNKRDAERLARKILKVDNDAIDVNYIHATEYSAWDLDVTFRDGTRRRFCSRSHYFGWREEVARQAELDKEDLS